MIDLEYLLLFGLPENKLELVDGKTRVVMAFPDPDEAETHRQHWLQTLQRWQEASATPCDHKYEGPGMAVAGFELFRNDCVVTLLVPMSTLAYANDDLQYDRETWGLGHGVAGFVEWWRFQSALSQKLGPGVSGTELLLTPDSMVSPLAYWFQELKKLPALASEDQAGLVDQHYVQGVPDLLVEILVPASETELRGEKMGFYREAGLPELWLINPDRRSIEVYHRLLDRFALVGEFGPGQTFSCHERLLNPAELLPEQHGHRLHRWEEAEGPAGLEHFLLGGAPFRRFDFYRGLARRWFACSSEHRSQALEKQTREELARWDPEGASFFLQRVTARVLRLDVRVAAPTHRRLFRYWHFEGRWR